MIVNIWEKNWKYSVYHKKKIVQHSWNFTEYGYFPFFPFLPFLLFSALLSTDFDWLAGFLTWAIGFGGRMARGSGLFFPAVSTGEGAALKLILFTRARNKDPVELPDIIP